MIQTTLFPDTFKPQSLAKEAFDSAEEENLINLNAVWTLVGILAAIVLAVYLAYIGDQVEFL